MLTVAGVEKCGCDSRNAGLRGEQVGFAPANTKEPERSKFEPDHLDAYEAIFVLVRAYEMINLKTDALDLFKYLNVYDMNLHFYFLHVLQNVMGRPWVQKRI